VAKILHDGGNAANRSPNGTLGAGSLDDCVRNVRGRFWRSKPEHTVACGNSILMNVKARRNLLGLQPGEE
jgi:hypothetical protein